MTSLVGPLSMAKRKPDFKPFIFLFLMTYIATFLLNQILLFHTKIGSVLKLLNPFIGLMLIVITSIVLIKSVRENHKKQSVTNKVGIIIIILFLTAVSMLLSIHFVRTIIAIFF